MATTAAWNWLLNARKRHYFGTDGRSLCGKWLLFGTNKNGDQDDNHTDNCAECKRRRTTRVGAGGGDGAEG